MNQVFNYIKIIFQFINNNAIITLFVTTITQILLNKSNRQHDEKKEKRQEFYNKAELRIVKKQWNSKETPDICLFLTHFKPVLSKNQKIECVYDKGIIRKSSHRHLRFYIKNIGNADINRLDICVQYQDNETICNAKYIKYYTEERIPNYSFCYDRKILKGETILLDIAYIEGNELYSRFISELLILFKDSYGNMYEQPFFIHDRNLYEPNIVSKNEYNSHLNFSDALENLKKHTID